MARKRFGFLQRSLTFLKYPLLGLSVALFIGLNHNLTSLNSPTGLALSLSGAPATAHVPTADATVIAITDASQLLEQGRTYYQAGQFAEALTSWQQAAQAYQAQGDELNQAAALSYLSLAYQQLGQLPQASDAIAQSLNLLANNQQTPNNKLILAQALNTQGSLQLTQGQAEQALATWKEAEANYAQAGDEAGRIGSLINQAQAQQTLGFYLRARQTLAGVEEALQKQQDRVLKTTGLRSLGNVLRLVGDLDGSTRVLQQSLAIAEKLASPQDVSATLLSLGNTARTQADTAAALSFYQQAAIAASTPTTKLQAQLNTFSLLLDAQQAAAANALLGDIQSELAKLPLSRPAIYAQINFAQNLATLKKKPVANTPSWSQIAQVAATAVQQAKNLGDQKAQAYALGSLGGIYEETQQWNEAQDLTEQALILAQSINAPDIAYRWQWQLGRLLKVQKEDTGAIAAYTEAVNTLQSLRSDLVAINSDVQFSFRKSVEPVYRELVELLLETDNTQNNPERLEQARKVIESLQLAELDNFFRTACLSAAPVQIDSIDQQAGVIYPIILPTRLEVILSLPKQPLRHYGVAVAQDQVQTTVTQLRRLLTQRDNPAFLPLSQQMYDWLIRPIEAELAQSEVKTLVFVLDGPLRNLPMAALHSGEQYLIEKYAVALTPGLELLESQPLARGELKILTAGLSQANQGFPALPFVEIELNEIHSQVAGEVLLNQEFTSTTLQTEISKALFPVVHLATHGQFSSKAEDTFILTWDDRIDVNELNNLLQATDLRRSQPIELLVLSACETARGDERAALGIAGVAVRAGARSTLASLWLVDDEATAGLMGYFYQELAKTEVTKAEALRRAQQSILQDPRYREHPYYWAPFVLVGNWL